MRLGRIVVSRNVVVRIGWTGMGLLRVRQGILEGKRDLGEASERELRGLSLVEKEYGRGGLVHWASREYLRREEEKLVRRGADILEETVRVLRE